MKYTIEQLSYIVPAISIGFLFIITSINVYFKIRRRFPATVNCWFCNENSKVRYDDLNKWTCPKCEQYNGFSEDGDYNCDIPAQRSAKFNKFKTSSSASMNGSIISSRMASVNGLCEPCNRNQELKVQQLASFEPENEAYFDEEIEEYRFKLEQAYRLCPRCERHLKRTLNKVKTNILGSKLRQIGAKGLQAFNLHLNEKANKNIVQKKRSTFARISLAVLILIAWLQLLTITNEIKITKSKLDSVFNPGTSTSILIILSYISAVKILMSRMIQYVIELPYVSLAVIYLQIIVKYVYTYINGDIWGLINMDFLELVDSNVADIDTNGSSTLITNVSGCFLSVFILFLFGLGWGSVLSLLLWSLSMAVPTMIQSTSDVRQLLILDFIQLILVWSSATLSIVNFFSLPNKQIKLSNAKNTSFHRIDSELNSDASDDSEVESELNSSLRSNMSSFSKRSSWNEMKLHNSTISSKSPLLYSAKAMRQRSYAASTQSIASGKPLSDLNASFGSENCFRRSSHMDLTQDKYNASRRSFMASQSPDIFGRTQCPSAMSFHSLNKTFTHGPESFRSPSRNSFYDIPNDFESGITQLSISGMGNKHLKKQSPVFGSSDAFGDSLRNRKAVISPSRLSLNDTLHPVNQSSWLAGGYWNSLSPQKKFPHHANNIMIEPQAVAKEVFPMISRASSKSSGFESRENSLCDDAEVDRTMLFSEPTSLTYLAKSPNELIKPEPYKAGANLFNGMNGNSCQQPISHNILTPTHVFANPSNQCHKISPNFSMMSHSFGQFSLQQSAQQSPIFSQNHNDILNSKQFTSNLSQYNKTKKDLPTYQRGSLIKLQESVLDNKIGQ